MAGTKTYDTFPGVRCNWRLLYRINAPMLASGIFLRTLRGVMNLIWKLPHQLSHQV